MLENLLIAAGWSHAVQQLDSGDMTFEQLEAGLSEAVKLTPPHRPQSQFDALKKALALMQRNLREG